MTSVYHARWPLRFLIAKHHGDHREIPAVLERLVHGGGTYTTGMTADTVALSRPEQPRFRRTAETLVKDLNAMRPKALGDSLFWIRRFRGCARTRREENQAGQRNDINATIRICLTDLQ